MSSSSTLHRTPKPPLLFALALVGAAIGCTSALDLDSYQITNDTRCGDVLVALSSDPANCGACGNVCDPNGSCASGSCVCNSPYRDCGGSCIDVDTDEAHCGACNAPCASGANCGAGACQCPNTSDKVCGDACTDVTTDVDHCGTCDNACASGASCAGGTCRCPNTTDQICADACTDVRTDVGHCGNCNTSCQVAHAGASCTSGSCLTGACSAGYDDCDHDLALGANGTGCEVDLGADSANCGACGNPCTGGKTCVSGSCVCSVPAAGGVCDPRTNCGCDSGSGQNCTFASDSTWQCTATGGVPTGTNCSASTDCVQGDSCVDGVCQPYCGPASSCPSGQACIGVFDANQTAIDGWGFCSAACNPSSVGSPPVSLAGCGSGQKCRATSGGSFCSARVGGGQLDSACTGGVDCGAGFYCNSSSSMCSAYCWLSSDGCAAFGDYECNSFSTPVLIEGSEVGVCLPHQGTAGCKQPCTADRDCAVPGTGCRDTVQSGLICLNTECDTCFNAGQTCLSDSTTCVFDSCQ